MARGERWTQEEEQLLREMMERDMTVEEIVKSGRFPNRTLTAVQVRASELRRGSIKNEREKNPIKNEKARVEPIVPIELNKLEAFP